MANPEYKIYRYDPSIVAAILFAALFLLTTLLHSYQLIRTKTTFFIPFLIGGIFEIVGYVAVGPDMRAINSTQSPTYSVPVYAVQTVLILLGPTMFAASIYMCLGRIITLTDGEEHSLIKRRWLTKIFVTGDIISFLAQGAGGGMMAGKQANALHIGETVIIVGLVLQLAFFTFFIVVALLFDFRMHAVPTKHVDNNWHLHMWALYGGSALILIRSVFRLIEYAQGNSGYLISHEIFLYVFDGVLMVATMTLFSIIHPSEVQGLLRKTGGKMVKGVIRVEKVRN